MSEVGQSQLDQILSQASVKLRALDLEEARSEVHRSIAVGDASGQPRGTGEAWEAWRNSTLRFHKAFDAMYPEVWQTLKDRLASGDPQAVEAAIVFLEADPMCFRSGYEKETLMRRLSHLDLGEKGRRRVRNIVIQVIQEPRRREYRGLVLLASSVWGPELQAGLDGLLPTGNDHVQRQVSDLRRHIAEHF